MSKEITIEELARMSQNEFTAIRSEMRAGFGAVEKRFDTVEKRFDTVEKRFVAVEKRFDGMDERFTSMDRQFEELKNILLADRKDFGERITRIEDTIGVGQ